jgi:hypothetical protein
VNRLSALVAHALHGAGEHAATDAVLPALAFEDVGVKYADGTVAFADVSLGVPRGQFCSLRMNARATPSRCCCPPNGSVPQRSYWPGPRAQRPHLGGVARNARHRFHSPPD